MVTPAYNSTGFRTIREGQPNAATGLRLDGTRELQMRGTGREVEAKLLRVREANSG